MSDEPMDAPQGDHSDKSIAKEPKPVKAPFKQVDNEINSNKAGGFNPKSAGSTEEVKESTFKSVSDKAETPATSNVKNTELAASERHSSREGHKSESDLSGPGGFNPRMPHVEEDSE